jgi:hypothetical protein
MRVLVGLLIVALLAAVAGVDGRAAGTQDSAAEPPRRTAFAFAEGTAEVDRQAFEAAVAGARPEARALVERIAGIVTVSISPTGRDAAGLTRWQRGQAEVIVDLAGVNARYGRRGIDRVVLHELGHVVDFELVPARLDASLDAAVPAGYGCDDSGRSGGCATREERFAESFAKWATGDIGTDLYLGYRIPPPPPDWGAPLARLTATGAS